jgi:hypothetical protein
MEKLVFAVVGVVIAPLLIFNYFAGIVGFIWLFWLGDWSSALMGFGAILVGPTVLAFPLMLALVFGLPAMWLWEKGFIGKTLSIPFIIIGGLVSWIVMSAWGIFVYYQASINGWAPNQSFAPILPYLLAAYAVSTAPWAYMASKEGPEGKTALPIIFTHLSAFWALLSTYMQWQGLAGPISGYVLIMALGFVISLISGLAFSKPVRPPADSSC